MPTVRQGILLCALALLTLGVVMVHSAGMRIEPASAETPVAATDGLTIAGLLGGRDGIFAALAIIAMAAGWLIPDRVVASLSSPRPDLLVRVGGIGLGGLLVMLLLVYVPGLSREMNASSRWIRLPAPGLGEVSIQPSEIVKWSMVGLVAWCAASAGGRLARFWTGLVPALAAVGLVTVVIMKEDLGTAALVGAVACLVLLGAGARGWHFAAIMPAGLAVIAGGLFAESYRLRRLTAFLDPYADPAGNGYHMLQSMGAVAGGEGAGRGLGHGLQKFGYLPEDTTDFIFAIICEELGVAGAGVVIALYAALLALLLAVVRGAGNPIQRLFVLGVMATIGLQASINLLVVTGLAPTKGIALPLISKGGSGWILTCLALGVVCAIDRARDRVSDAAPEDAPDPAPRRTLSLAANGQPEPPARETLFG
ncbi:MAG: FtsW/RodA/SpoVE family cell cycle protein [Planctomycetota bacterium]